MCGFSCMVIGEGGTLGRTELLQMMEFVDSLVWHLLKFWIYTVDST